MLVSHGCSTARAHGSCWWPAERSGCARWRAELRDATSVVADLADPDDRRPDRRRDAVERFGRVDVLVNNAGAAEPISALEEPIDTFRAVVDAQRRRHLSRSPSRRRGRCRSKRGTGLGGHGAVVNISSIFGLVGVGQIPHAAYAASKTALVGLTRELGAQWARSGVRVNALAPGWFQTEMTDGSMFDDAGSRSG